MELPLASVPQIALYPIVPKPTMRKTLNINSKEYGSEKINGHGIIDLGRMPNIRESKHQVGFSALPAGGLCKLSRAFKETGRGAWVF